MMHPSIPSSHPSPAGNAEDGLAVLQENALELIDGLEAGTANLGDALSATLTLAEAHCVIAAIPSAAPTFHREISDGSYWPVGYVIGDGPS